MTKIKHYTLGVKEETVYELDSVQVTSSDIAAKFARQLYNDDILIYETFYVIIMNRKNETVGYAKIGQGGVSATVVDIKIVAKFALDCLASSIIMVHNHPSGNTSPSSSDINLTKKIKDGLSNLDINILDHIILTKESYSSFTDEGLL